MLDSPKFPQESEPWGGLLPPQDHDTTSDQTAAGTADNTLSGIEIFQVSQSEGPITDTSDVLDEEQAGDLEVSQDAVDPVDAEAAAKRGRLRRLSIPRLARLAFEKMQVPIAIAETTFPINEILTYGPPIAVGILTKNPIATGLAAGIPTTALELAGARVGANILGAKSEPSEVATQNEQTEDASGGAVRHERGKVEKIIDKFLDSQTLRKFVPQRGEKLDKTTLGVVTLYGGTIAGQKLKEREDSRRTPAELWQFGSRAAYMLGAICTAEAVAGEEGIANWDHPYVSGPIALAALGAVFGLRRIKNYVADRSKLSRQTATLEELEQDRTAERVPLLITDAERVATEAKPNYKLTDAELGVLESELVAKVKESYPQEGVVAVWVRPHSKFANFVRVHESRYFPEVADISEENEDNTLFLALVDTREASSGIVHGGTVTGIGYSDNDQVFVDGSEANDEASGLYTVDALTDPELGNFNLQDFQEYYADRGIDLKKCIAVETNFVIKKEGQKAARFEGLRTSDLAYLMFYKLAMKRAPELNRAGVFATINRASINSFDRFGLSYEYMMGRSDLVTPESKLGRESLPVLLPYDTNNSSLFDSINIPECVV